MLESLELFSLLSYDGLNLLLLGLPLLLVLEGVQIRLPVRLDVVSPSASKVEGDARVLRQSGTVLRDWVIDAFLEPLPDGLLELSRLGNVLVKFRLVDHLVLFHFKGAS